MGRRYNTSVTLICDEGNGTIVSVTNNKCHVSIIITSLYACGTSIPGPSLSPFNLIVFFGSLFGTILLFLLVAGLIYGAGRCLRRYARRHRSEYAPIADMPPISAPPINVSHEYVDGKQPTSCTVCCDRAVDTVLLDCGHSVLCQECTSKIKTCPMCRADIKKVVLIYHV
ncbi:hypothetical protein SAMD00019534_077990 [Acytostelium subglobosum LB1]|uniref:hypothetical protein n=1 Tax=Acytostelium subglobosum LB1 TaxID=1410327 RepID=UPI00064495A3|nr:hypothetical protein SAMD00019534_077990 [Acytostelium subglobosum LB1]GAM24624.1 hypothetical protein SAMD00019534_077990 [Acytostelium subglobosum LB1]|eukprot:XP_012752293.1 hypothetical protein SAMD00019534_077990 [Acytostelium subglobosum LB1]